MPGFLCAHLSKQGPFVSQADKNANPTALIFVGGPSSSKTTVADMFADAYVTVTDGGATHELFYLSDSFTPAAFVSQAASRSAKELRKSICSRGLNTRYS